MQLDELRSRLLTARDQRDEIVEEYKFFEGSTLVLSTNIPGVNKLPDGICELFSSGCKAVKDRLNVSQVITGEDAAGLYMVCNCEEMSETAKRIAVWIEENLPAGRLLDIDIYKQGEQLGRREIGLPARKCIVCGDPAVDCIRSKKHDVHIITNQVEKMLQRTHS